MEIFIRQATILDIPELKSLFRITVLSINKEDYTEEQVEDWASCGNDIKHWIELLKEQNYVVAKNEKGMIVGFASVSDVGYINALFVHKKFNVMVLPCLCTSTLKLMPRKWELKYSHLRLALPQSHSLKNKGFKSMQDGGGK